MKPFTVTLPHFEGPLELLLHLIEKRELDITTLSLATVTDEFLGTLRQMERADPATIADFLVVAAKLVLIKSSLLLPGERAESADEDEGEQLARALESYRLFKQAATVLASREATGQRSYPRRAPAPVLERRLDPQGASPTDLFRALRQLLQEHPPEPENVDGVVRPLRITVRQRIQELTARLRLGEPLEFGALLGREASRQEVIATFLAMLELLKLGWARARQEGLWGRIEIVPDLAALPEEERDDGAAQIDEYI